MMLRRKKYRYIKAEFELCNLFTSLHCSKISQLLKLVDNWTKNHTVPNKINSSCKYMLCKNLSQLKINVSKEKHTLMDLFIQFARSHFQMPF